jgi:hypothetical protein
MQRRLDQKLGKHNSRNTYSLAVTRERSVASLTQHGYNRDICDICDICDKYQITFVLGKQNATL